MFLIRKKQFNFLFSYILFSLEKLHSKLIKEQGEREREKEREGERERERKFKDL